MVDKNCIKLATLVGFAKIGVLSARTVKALDLINDVANHNDYRDDLSAEFYAQVREGNIRTDANWSKGADATLMRLI